MQESPWSRSIILTLLASITIEIGMLLYQSWAGEHSMLMPWTFFTLWGGGALGVIAWKASQLNVSLHEFFGIAFIAAGISVVGNLFMPQLVTPRYFGVYSLGTHYSPRYQGFLYHKHSPELEREVNEFEYHRTHGFIHWQTGLAAGFYPDPDSVPDYNDPHGFAEHLELALAKSVERIVTSWQTASDSLASGTRRIAFRLVDEQLWTWYDLARSSSTPK